MDNSQGIFIVGFPRSGTTLLRLLLDAHSQIAIPFESFVLVDFAKKWEEKYHGLDNMGDRRNLIKDLLSSKGISRWSPAVQFSDIDLKKCDNYSNALLQIYQAYAKKCNKRYWGDKTPSYIADLHIINEIFPGSKFIHLIRDGRDVSLSLLKQPWGENSLLLALRRWKEVVGWSRKMGRMLPPGYYFELRYEDLIKDPERYLKKIANFLGLPFENEMITGFQDNINKKIPTGSWSYHNNLKKEIDQKYAYKWKASICSTDQHLCFEIAGDLLSELGYERGYRNSSLVKVRLRQVYHILHERIGFIKSATDF